MALQIGYQLSSEEHGPSDLVRYAQLAEEYGFTFATISDHFHPWIDAQGQSSFGWSVIGAIAQVTKELELGTWATCPTTRIHPAIIAQASATVAAMMPGRFFLGVGTGENLNEHDQEGFFQFFASEVLPRVGRLRGEAGGGSRRPARSTAKRRGGRRAA